HRRVHEQEASRALSERSFDAFESDVGGRASGIFPDHQLGRARAFEIAGEVFPERGSCERRRVRARLRGGLVRLVNREGRVRAHLLTSDGVAGADDRACMTGMELYSRIKRGAIPLVSNRRAGEGALTMGLRAGPHRRLAALLILS